MTYRIYSSRFNLKHVIYLQFSDIVNETEKAYLLAFGARHVWLPKSLIATNKETKIIACPSTIAADREILEYRADGAKKINRASLEANRKILLNREAQERLDERIDRFKEARKRKMAVVWTNHTRVRENST